MICIIKKIIKENGLEDFIFIKQRQLVNIRGVTVLIRIGDDL